MKLITKSIAALAAGLFFALTVACAKPAPPADPGQTPKYPEAVEFAMSLGVGWNLGNSFDAHIDGMSGETLWGNPVVTRELFKALKAAGFGSVRIPVTWMGHIGKAPEYRIEKAWLDRVAEVAGYARD